MCCFCCRRWYWFLALCGNPVDQEGDKRHWPMSWVCICLHVVGCPLNNFVYRLLLVCTGRYHVFKTTSNLKPLTKLKQLQQENNRNIFNKHVTKTITNLTKTMNNNWKNNKNISTKTFKKTFKKTPEAADWASSWGLQRFFLGGSLTVCVVVL